MKKILTIAFAMSALLFVSVAANAQYPSSRNMERRGQSNQFDQRDGRSNNHRPKVSITFGAHGSRGYDRYNDRRRYNDHRRNNRYDRHDRYDRRRRSHHSNW